VGVQYSIMDNNLLSRTCHYVTATVLFLTGANLSCPSS
jgi:hypothetical protein